MKKKDYINILIILVLSLTIIVFVTGFSNLFGSDTDWVNQHTVFPEYMRNNFYETGNLVPNFSMNYGGGQNFYNISYYGYLNPIILISYLLPNVSMVTYMIVVNVLLVLLSVFLFYKWLRNNKNSETICFVSTLLFAFNTTLIFHMHRHIMFVSYMPFLIMTLMGVDKILEKNKKSFFVMSLFLLIMTSYYFSISGSVLIGCYFIYKYLKLNNKIKIKDFPKQLLKLVLLGLLAAGIAAILLLPTFHTLISGRGEGGEEINLIKLFIPTLKIHQTLGNTYGIGYSFIGLASSIYLIFTKKKENIFLAIILLSLIFLPFTRYLLNASFYLKEKCLIPFNLLMGIAVTIFIKDLSKNKVDIKKISILMLIIGIPLLIINKFRIDYFYTIYLVIILFIYSKKENFKFLAFALITVAFITCIYKNSSNDFVSHKTYNKYFNHQYEKDINAIIDEDKSYYRISNLMYPVKTVNKIYNKKHYSTGLYTSTYNNEYLDFVRNVFKVNNPDFNYFFISSSDNILFNKFMGVKYIYSPYSLGLEYKDIKENIYKSDKAFPMAYHRSNLMSEEDFDKLSYPNSIVAILKNAIISGKTNVVFENQVEKVSLDYYIEELDNKNITINKNEKTVNIEVLNDTNFKIKLNEPLTNKILFISFLNLKKNKCSVGNDYIKINGITNLLTCETWEYPNKNDLFHYVISGESLDTLNIEISKGTYEITDIEVYMLDYDLISDINDITPFNIKSISDKGLKGDIEVLNDGYFVTSIPYDEGFKIKVNNKEVKPEIVNKAFLGFKLEKGDYQINIYYEAPLFEVGRIITILSSLIFCYIIIAELKKH